MSFRKTAAAVLAFAAAGLFGAAGLAQTALHGPAPGPGEIILYEHANYGGREVRISATEPNLQRVRFNDLTSSFRIVAGTWELCQHDNFRGTCEIHSTDRPSMGRMNDQLTSLRPVGGHPDDPGRPGRESITLYSGYDFTGRWVTLTETTPDLSRSGFNDQARSIRHNGRRAWRVCADAHFRGACMEVSGDIPRLGGGMAGSISSAEPDYGSYPGPGGGNYPRTGVNLFDGVNFTGQRVEIGGEERNLRALGFNDRADSLVVARGETWIVCEHADFRGRCVEVRGAVEDLTRYGLRNEISSMRRVDGYPGGPGHPPPGGHTDITGGVRGSDALFFGRPEIRGYGVDACLAPYGRRCGAEVAEAICHNAGYRHAAHFDIDRRHRARTWQLGSNRECQGDCAPIVDVLCTN